MSTDPEMIKIEVWMPADGPVGTLESALCKIAVAESCKLNPTYKNGAIRYELLPRPRAQTAQSPKVVSIDSRRRERWAPNPHSPLSPSAA